MYIHHKILPSHKCFMRCYMFMLVISCFVTGCALKETKENAIQKSSVPKSFVGCWRLAAYSEESKDRNGNLEKMRTIFDIKKHTETFYVGIYADGRFVQWLDDIDCPKGFVLERSIGTIEIVGNDDPGRWKFNLPLHGNQVIHRLVTGNADTVRFCQYYRALSFPRFFDSTDDLDLNQTKETYDYTRCQFDIDTIQILP